MRTITSKMTSVNTFQLPAVWKKLNYEWMSKHKISDIVDYGAGRKATQNNVFYYLLNNYKEYQHYWPYDPYWVDEDRNKNAISCLLAWRQADLCVCANVLNVIKEMQDLHNIISQVTQAEYWVFQIYEGDKTGIGKETKPDCWQRNSKTQWYADVIRDIIKSPAVYTIKGKYITNCIDIIKL